MRKITFLFVILFTYSSGSAQIKITHERSRPKFDLDDNEIRQYEKPDENADHPVFKNIIEAFKSFNFEPISKYLEAPLDDEIDSILKALEPQVELFEKSRKVYYSSNTMRYESDTDGEGYAKFESDNDSIGTLQIIYSHNNDTENFKISLIRIFNQDDFLVYFPSYRNELHKYYSALRKLPEGSEFRKKIEYHNLIINALETRKKYALEAKDQMQINSQLSHYYGNLSFYYCLENEADNALNAGKKGLTKYLKDNWINTNIALAYAIKGDFESATKTYKNYLEDNKHYLEDHKIQLKKDLELCKSRSINISRYNDYLDFIDNQ